MKLNKFLKDTLFWIIIALIQLFGISAISFGFGFRPLGTETFIILGTLLLVNGTTKMIVQWNTEDKEKNTSSLYKNWKKRIGKLLEQIKMLLGFEEKRGFTIEANNREQKSAIMQKLEDNKIDIFFYNEGLKRVEKYKLGNKKSDEQLERFEKWLEKQEELNKKQKKALSKILLKGVKYKLHTIAELNTFGEKKSVRVYDLKDYTGNEKLKDFAVWLIISTIIFLGISSLIIQANENLLYALSQSLFMIISVAFNITMAIRNAKKYVNVNKVDYFKEIDAYYCDALKFSGKEITAILEKIMGELKVKSETELDNEN